MGMCFHMPIFNFPEDFKSTLCRLQRRKKHRHNSGFFAFLRASHIFPYQLHEIVPYRQRIYLRQQFHWFVLIQYHHLAHPSSLDGAGNPIERIYHVVECHHVPQGIFLPDLYLILSELHVLEPVKVVLDSPSAAYCLHGK